MRFSRLAAWKLSICMSAVASSRMAQAQTTAAAASQPSTGRAPSKAPYRARHGPNMKMVWPRKTLKSDAHQKCLPICRRMPAYLQSSWPTPPLETKLKVRRQPQTATSVHASSRRTPSLGHAGHARARIRTHCTGGQPLQMKSTGHTLPSGRLSSQSSTLTPASAPASMARSAGSGSMVGPQPVSRGPTQQADSSLVHKRGALLYVLFADSFRKGRQWRPTSRTGV